MNYGELFLTEQGQRCRIDRARAAPYAGAMRMADRIEAKLRGALAPSDLAVVDESDQHHGHAGHQPGGETHFRIYVIADAFRGKTRLQRHRLVNDLLAEELRGGVHALALHAKAPGE